MRSMIDSTADIDEKSTERMNFRVKPRIKETIQRAAALSGMDDSAFTTNAAYQFGMEDDDDSEAYDSDDSGVVETIESH